MLRGLDTAASGMYSLERKQETLADNLANVQTPGYKKDDTALRAFPQMLIQRIRDYSQNNVPVSGAPQLPGMPVPVGPLYTGVYAQENIPNFSEGAVVQTGKPLDVAINDQSLPTQTVNGRQVKPAAMFAVQLPGGSTGYTRNGNWDLDANGHVVTSDGNLVLGADQKPIQITGSINKADLQIDSQGRIVSNAGDPAKMKTEGQIGIVLAQNPGILQRSGNNVYKTTTPLPFTQGNPGVTLQQGYVEQSNVDSAQTMSDMTAAVRGYEANQKVISTYDTSLEQLFTTGKPQ